MTYQDFKKKFLGRGIDFDKAYKNQCVDVYRQYCHELGFPQSPPVRGAVNIWDTFLPKHFDKIPNTPKGIPDQGDVIIWGTAVSSYGHCAIFDHGDVNNFVSLDQNWPFDNGEGVLHEQKHDYKGVLGWLRPKLSPAPTSCEEEKKEIGKLQEQLKNSQTVQQQTATSLSEITAQLADKTKELTKSQSATTTANKTITEKEEEIGKLNRKIEKLNGDIEEITKGKTEYRALYEKALERDVTKISYWKIFVAIFTREQAHLKLVLGKLLNKLSRNG